MKRDRKRLTGLEQEFLLVDEPGRPSEAADEFLRLCADRAAPEGLDPDDFSEECSLGMVEVKTSPTRALDALEDEYLANVGFAVRVGRELGLRLYPLATYPLPMTPSFRDGDRYRLQIQTMGRERFLDAGRCFGVHLHVEVEAGVVDPVEVVARDASSGGLRDLLSVYNLATALDPALVSLTRSCPFYEGRAPGVAPRTAYYRGSVEFDWDGVYSKLPELGSLQPYAKEAEDLVKRQTNGLRIWREAMDSARVGRAALPKMSAGILDVCWRPVRLSPHGTVELRSLDSNFPDVVLAVSALVRAVTDRVRQEDLTVEPTRDLRRFETDEKHLFVPDFPGVGSELFHAAATEGPNHPALSAYLDSILEFALSGESSDKFTRYAKRLKNEDGSYRTTEAEVLRRTGEDRGPLTEEAGLALVREACDGLEEKVGAPRPVPG